MAKKPGTRLKSEDTAQPSHANSHMKFSIEQHSCPFYLHLDRFKKVSRFGISFWLRAQGAPVLALPHRLHVVAPVLEHGLVVRVRDALQVEVHHDRAAAGTRLLEARAVWRYDPYSAKIQIANFRLALL